MQGIDDTGTGEGRAKSTRVPEETQVSSSQRPLPSLSCDIHLAIIFFMASMQELL